ncbi:MFS transporter [Streptomyces beihaiensis]|uniref:Sugar porter family MFS transporter n=1 Tax=Streptomyces beihaiensis TaxID=2984495 RepID=A0ABT3TQU9_9ACTN|nr:MFS transporter [Streptomyces beihaiensis]MCX3059422.1 sugar porter family MFS transporter [Streptomyces beihaiensis]
MSIRAIDEMPLTGFHRKLTWACAGGPFLDGYLLSIVGVALVGMSGDLALTTAEQSMIGASALVGIFFGGLCMGPLTDRIGREAMYTADLAVLVVGSVVSVFADAAWQIILLRFVLGVAIGADYPIATSLLAEWAPTRHRGRLLGYLILAWYVGAAAAYVIGYAIAESVGSGAWRWMVASGAVLSALVLLIRVGTPESPLWLVNKGRTAQAQKAIEQAIGRTVPVPELLAAAAVEQSASTYRLRDLFKGVYLRRTLFCGLFYTCQITPMFALYTFGPAILVSFGLHDGNTGNLGSALISLVFALGCLPALRMVDRIGRRPVIIWSFALMAVPLVVLGGGAALPLGVVIACFCAYALFSGGPTVLEWSYPNELFPTSIRATAGGVATSLSRVGAAVGTFLLPISLTGLGVGTTMLIGAGITLVGWVVSVAWAEETKGRTLAESSGLPGDAHSAPADSRAVPR